MTIELKSPSADVTTNWDLAEPGAAHFSGIDDPKNESQDGQYIKTLTANDDDRFEIEDTSQTGGETTTSVEVHMRAQINDPAATAKLRFELFHTTSISLGAKDVIAANLGGFGQLGDFTLTWPGLGLSDVQTNSLEVKVTLLAS